MKRFLLLPVMILLLSSCGEGTGTLSVILPENASYEIELRGKNGWKVDAETASDAFFSNLIPGIYTLEVISFKGETYGFYKKTVRIREGRNEEKVEFEKNTSLLLQIRTPSDVRDALLYIRLEGEEGITMEKKVEVEKEETLILLDDIKEGVYELYLECKSNDSLITEKEMIMIEEGHNTHLLNIKKESDKSPSLSIVDGSATPIKGKIEVKDIDRKNGYITLAFSLADETSTDVTASWYVDGIYETEGEYVTIDTSKNFKRIDLLLSSPDLGSYGSASMTFSSQ